MTPRCWKAMHHSSTLPLSVRTWDTGFAGHRGPIPILFPPVPGPGWFWSDSSFWQRLTPSKEIQVLNFRLPSVARGEILEQVSGNVCYSVPEKFSLPCSNISKKLDPVPGQPRLGGDTPRTPHVDVCIHCRFGCRLRLNDDAIKMTKPFQKTIVWENQYLCGTYGTCVSEPMFYKIPESYWNFQSSKNILQKGRLGLLFWTENFPTRYPNLGLIIKMINSFSV